MFRNEKYVSGSKILIKLFNFEIWVLQKLNIESNFPPKQEIDKISIV